MDKKLQPLISIIIAVYNGDKTIQECIDSISQQSYPHKEIIIIDGGSKDGTVNLLKANSEKLNYWISEPDTGIYNAWNKGLAQANGDWICFLGADDFFWNTQVLEQMSEQLATLTSEILVAYGQIMLLNNESKPLYLVGEPWVKVKERFKHKMSIPHQAVMHRDSLFKLYGNFDESFSIVGDYELLLRELKAGNASFIPNIIVTGMRQGGISSNPKLSLVILREVRRAQVMHGQLLPGRIWILALMRVYIRMFLWMILGENLTRKALDFGRRIMGLPVYWTKT